MIKLNSTLINQLSQIQNQQLAKCINNNINSILEKFIHEPNNTATREEIKAKVLNLLYEAINDITGVVYLQMGAVLPVGAIRAMLRIDSFYPIRIIRV